VFLGERGPLTVSGMDMIFNIIEKKAGITDVWVSAHTMRHTFSKQYLKHGGDLFKLSRELGHSSVQVTGKIYLSDFNSTDACQDHDRYSPIDGVKLGKIKDGKKGKRPK